MVPLIPLVVAGWWGCGTRPHYAQASFSWGELGAEELQAARDGVARDLSRGRLRAVQVAHAPGDPEAWRALPDEALFALYAVSRRSARGAEMDLWLPHSDRPMTVVFAGRDAHLTLGDSPPAQQPAALDPAELSARHGLGPLLDGDSAWTAEALEALSIALDALHPAERATLRHTVWRRSALAPRAARRELARFDPSEEPPHVWVYDLALAQASSFVGPVTRPLPAASLSIAHEIGHALADWPARAWALGAGPPPSRRGPVIDAWRAVRDGPGPTPYRSRNLHESFAEAFALHLLDPAALRRVMPRAAGWFADGGHREALGWPTYAPPTGDRP